MSDVLRADEEQIVSGRAPFASPAPSCLGGAHRRCLLDAESCSCECHKGVEVPRVAPIPVWVCAVCGERFRTERARVRHFDEAHPVMVDAGAQPPQPIERERSRDHRCDGCDGRFLTRQGLISHQSQKRCGRAFPKRNTPAPTDRVDLSSEVAAFERSIDNLEREIRGYPQAAADSVNA